MKHQLISWNVNGIRACQKKGFVEWLAQEDAEVVAIQETKAQENQLDDNLLHIDGYQGFYFSAEKKGYSGVALYTKREPLAIEPLGIDAFDSEGRTVIAHFPEYSLINCYFPNSQDKGARLEYKLAFCDAILEKCNQLVSEGKQVALCGDYNIAHRPIDLKNPKANEKNAGYLPEERAWMTSFLEAGYIDTFRKLYPDEPDQYSWWSYRFKAREKNVGWRIDYFSVNQGFADKVVEAAILKDVMGSDHCPVSITIDL